MQGWNLIYFENKARKKARRCFFLEDPSRFRTRVVQNKKRKKELRPKVKCWKNELCSL